MASYGSLMPTAARSLLSSCRSPLRQGSMAPLLSSFQQVRGAKNNPQAQGKKNKEKSKKTKKGAREFKQRDLKDMDQFALCDAMRYLRAFEVGHEPATSKYEVHVRLKTMKDGPVIRNMLRFPHSVQTESRICVVCPAGSRHEKEARAAGAVLVGEQEVFDNVKKGIIEFDRLICHPDSLEALNRAGLGRVLGPRGLMPSAKTGTVVEDVASRVEMLRGGTVYRERDAVIRLPIGQLAFTPEQLRDNLRATLEQIKKDAAGLNDRINKEIYEVVLSSTNGPGFSLNGEFKSDNSPDTASLSGL
ncbi:ribosomal protein L1-like protein [Aspergillus pseudonomiae]|uniref:Mitochondrial 54S ribosomal protein MRPL1 n=2 Tax=Aspergillus subgen. Circumdati TaxID=2720871 RepID=A0A0L1JAG4_ASPN3|nr:mitochondrial 54S ribosomal protein MRPL1 [Aspergillus nomiae NRRL 13137]XP_031938707.1 ribosomal protein L1-like protein [Aspergillus pseudonomiae]KAB8265545.1 ribosomal protein L1-like protein [Aspergillus pseudonomiae]KAE8401388.1 ribosomal protein L1-like protein [Aspergillus pseudonomiae]KNG88739.1 mitochondrial 54S ribosomal protein MRPL1 [Aspergillus nomiae NRRL 13137]